MSQLQGRTAYGVVSELVPGGVLLLGLTLFLPEAYTLNVVELTGLFVGGFVVGLALHTVSWHAERHVHRQQEPLWRVFREYVPDLESLSSTLAVAVSAFLGHLYAQIVRIVVEHVTFVLFLPEDEKP